MGRRLKLAIGVAFAGMLLAQPAAALERVQDGGFESANCTSGPSGVCTSAVWNPARSSTASTGPICRTGVGNCGTAVSVPVAARTGFSWAQMGGYDQASAGVPVSYSIEQQVSIPAAPATLNFYMRVVNNLFEHSSLAVKIDGQTVYGATGDTPANPYVLVTVDVSGFAGVTRTLRFEATQIDFPGPGSTDSFNVDDISLDAPDAPSASATPTLSLAAAIKRCKKKFPKGPKRKKCIRKAKRRAGV